jgi:hypothetical protein
MDIGERVSIFNVVQNSTHFLRSFLTGKQEKEDPRNTSFFFFFIKKIQYYLVQTMCSIV